MVDLFFIFWTWCFNSLMSRWPLLALWPWKHSYRYLDVMSENKMLHISGLTSLKLWNKKQKTAVRTYFVFMIRMRESLFMASVTEIIQKTKQVRKIRNIAEIQISLSFFFITYIPLRNVETSCPLFFSMKINKQFCTVI